MVQIRGDSIIKKIVLIRFGILFLSLVLVLTPVLSASSANHEIPANQWTYISDNDQISSSPDQISPLKLCKQLFSPDKTTDVSFLSLFTSTIHTRYEDIEKTTEITFSSFNQIDIDNDDTTGINGNDISIQYLLLPYFYTDPDIRIGLMYTMRIERIADELQHAAFSITAELGDNIMRLAVGTPQHAAYDIPRAISFSSTIFLQIPDQTLGFSFSMDPEYDTMQGNNPLELSAQFDDSSVEQEYSFIFEPAISTEITIAQTDQPHEWEYQLIRDISSETTLTVSALTTDNQADQSTIITITPLPVSTTFRLSLTPFSTDGGSLYYESSTMYETTIIVESQDLGDCKYALLRNTPRFIDASWIPSKENGIYDIEMDSDGTDIYLLDTLEQPSINLSLQDIAFVDMTAYWNLTDEGDLLVIKEPSLHIDLDILFDEWELRLDAEPVAERIFFAWKADTTGYLTLDTEWQPLSQIGLLVKGPDLGINTIGDSLKADDFHLEWTVWPPLEFDIDKTGSVDFIDLSIDLFIYNYWYHLWPWF